MKWFKHDTNAHTDAKLDKVLMHYGANGYAVYWYCLELIAGKIDSQNIGCALEHDAEQIGSRLKIDSVEVTAILTYMVDIGLFEKHIEGAITCLKLLGRLDKSMTNSPQLRSMIGQIRQETSGNVMTCHDMSGNVTPEENRREEKRTDKNKTPIPKNFSISDGVRSWAEKHGHRRLNAHLEHFTDKAKAKSYRYADWDAAFKTAIRQNWAGIQ
ncbi:MAG: DUF4373 domain-containing protein [Luminiphilus sp.]|nr:DUF4373 domain-containing protein [Luminiphilus sp.]